MGPLEAKKPEVLEADTIYLLMKKGFPISRNVRAQWVLKHLDTVVTIQDPSAGDEETSELEIVSVLPKEAHSWCLENSHLYLYKVTSSTTIKFLAHKYRMVFSLDLSPSLATINIQTGEIVLDEVFMAMKRCLEGLTKPFNIPGSKRLLHPEIYVTVIVHTPFFTNPAQQVLVQGWLVTLENVASLMQAIEYQLNLLEEKVAQVTSIVNLQLESSRAESEKLVGGLFEENGTNIGKSNAFNNMSTIAMVSPETSFVNMFRYGMLALSLLPEHSCAHLVIISDGIVGVNDIHVMESVIQQLRATTIACSFLHVGGSYHPHSANGLVPYPDLLRFIATATLGSYMSVFPLVTEAEKKKMNVYHENLLCWQLYRSDYLEVASPSPNTWHTKNNLFYGHEPPQLLRKKQVDDQVTCTLNSLLCCRLREGYLIKKTALRDGSLEICFVLPWKTHVYIEYLVTCPRFTKSLSVCSTLQYTVTIEAPYDFLHDITCLSKKPLKSQYRQSMVSRFWTTLTSLTESDSMLAHFSWFPGMGWTWYNVPDTIRSGMPVFYLPTSSSSSIQLSDAACPQFGQIWQPVVSLEPQQWPRWLHAQRVTLILLHDRPLSKHLHQANQSGRFQSVQYRQAATVLYGMLKSWATFVLVENHSYVQFIYREPEKPPIAFSLINVSCKSLCVVLNVAFAGGTEGLVRHNVMADLLERLAQLSLPSRRIELNEVPCCIILHKALEKILIKYERVPIDLSTVVFPDGSQIIARNASKAGGCLTTTLSRYLYHTRWLWLLKKPALQTIPAISLPRLNVASIARILSTITKIRLAEGFNFAYSAAGIINTVMEVQMRGTGNNDATYPCILQYILFPPHVVVGPGGIEKDSGSDEETDEDGENGIEESETSGDFQIVMEVWVEPQCGYVQTTKTKKACYMHFLEYNQLPNAMCMIDKECINALLTLEYLSLICQESSNDVPQQQIGPPVNGNGNPASFSLGKTLRRTACAEGMENPLIDDRIRSMQFDFDALGILPKFQQAELLFSMFADDGTDQLEGENNANKSLMEGLMNHIKSLHNKELVLSAADSDRFTKMLTSRPREEGPKSFFCNYDSAESSGGLVNPRWRCFVKGISVTHVIVTLLPASESDVHRMAYPEDTEVERHDVLSTTPVFSTRPDDSTSEQPRLETTDDAEVESSRSGDASPVQRNRAGTEESNELKYLRDALAFSTPKPTTTGTAGTTNSFEKTTAEASSQRRSLVLPVYVYDCALALLIDVLVEKLDKPRLRDIHQDHTFRLIDQYQEEFVNLKSGDSTKPSSPEPKSEDSDNVVSDQRNLTEHCKVLNLAHCNAYVMAIYRSLVLQRPLGHDDMEAAVEQCEEHLIEINITDYLRAVCRHLDPDFVASGTHEHEESSSSCSCSDMYNIHKLIKDKFKKIINVSFKQVPVHPDYYYCLPSWKSEKLENSPQISSDSDDDVRFTFNSDAINGKLNGTIKKANYIGTVMWSGNGTHERFNKHSESSESTESYVSDLQTEPEHGRDQPLFLQLNCSIHVKSKFCSTAVKHLPTCFTEITQKLEDYNLKDKSSSNLKITLDIICLNLPKEVLEVSIDHTPSGLRTTSYCSEGSMRGPSESECQLERLQSSDGDLMYEGITNLPPYQYSAVSNLVEEIQWLLRDETMAVLLDKTSPSEETLNYVACHVADSNNRSSCYMDKVPLHFVFSSDNSLPRFIEELKRLTVDRYCIRQEGSLFYFVKKVRSENATDIVDEEQPASKDGVKEKHETFDSENSVFNSENSENTSSSRQVKKQDSVETPGCHSENSSIDDNQVITDDGYEGDTSDTDDDDEYQWLVELDQRRELLPNFWLILRVESDHVYVYFHCRFLELTSPEVDSYRQVQKTAVSQIKAICRRVNQFLLLRDLHDKRMCDPLLEPESMEDNKWKGTETGVDSNASIFHSQSCTSNITPGMFRCPIVWEVLFCLHHRLKTGPGRTGLSRGIKALQAVLNRFSVNNRGNMFVYQESNGNVFYLRLHERTYEDRPLQNNKLSESDEKLMVSRSSSVASLSQTKSLGQTIDQTSFSTTDADLLRPRVRSFGERESDILNKSEDSILIMVHGISEVGPEVRCELVQVLQNRLDDAVLEVLSVMLARNPMCKLTPSDVHFIQRPYRAPENVIRFSVQQHCHRHMGALSYYLRQNILQFLYTPKYTDPRQHSHFQDYSQPEGSNKRVPESDIFLYNQSHSSGSRGIVCIAVAVVNDKGDIIPTENEKVFDTMLPVCPNIRDFDKIVSTDVYWGETCEKKDTQSMKAYIEFRIWKQGRVNLEALVQKLKAAMRHANWDLITEYTFLPNPLAIPINDDFQETDIKTDPRELNSYELGEKGRLNKVYHTTLAYWFQFALDISAPAIKKHVVRLERQHSMPVILKELQNLVHSHALDTTAQTFVQWNRQPFVDNSIQDELLLSKFTENADGSSKWFSKVADLENLEDSVFLPLDSSKEHTGMYIRSILIARNFNQWKASFSNEIEAEQLMPKDQKLLQKFNPLILEKTFVPRQRLLLAKVQSQHIIIYMYNWSKERSEKLISQVTNLGLWLSSRSNLYSNIIMQKLGIFHHQPVRNFEIEEQSNSPCYLITDMESLAKFPNAAHSDKEWQRINNRTQSGKASMGLTWNQLMGQVMRDAKPSGQYPPNTNDPIVKAAYDFQELRHKDKKSKDDLNRLHAIWQSRGSAPTIPIALATLNTFKQHSRLIHYCHTPLLFLPTWRLQSAATRDHSLTPPPIHLAPNQQQRSRTTSDATNKKVTSEWHREICSLMLTEYKQYLQVLGFNPIQIESHQKTEGESVLNQAFYLKKTMLGGILLFEIHLAEPFFIVKLRVIECSRLQAKSNSALVNQFMLSFVDACDKIKINMHLHSFTYDFHLRCMHSYIAGNTQWSLKHGYHLTNFLDDFNKYYSKAPNYARNLIYSGVVTVSNLMTPAHTLYQYLLSHEKVYGMQVFSMSDDTGNTQRNEYVLVRLQSTPLVSYHDAQDTKYTNDFDVALIVTWLDQFRQTDSREITLKYYLMLTSKRELYPKREVESNNKIGKFRTVYSVVRSMTSSQLESPSESSPASTASAAYLGPKQARSDPVFGANEPPPPPPPLPAEDDSSKPEKEHQDSEELGRRRVSSPLAPTPPPVPEAPLAPHVLATGTTSSSSSSSCASTSQLSQIREESVNYLGYYSSHEQLMQQLIMSQASAAQQHIRSMIERGALHCRTHLLWNRLLETRSPMTYAEFAELRSLACVEPLSSLDPRLGPLVQQPISWYQGLAKVLQNKYQEYHKQFVAPDGNLTHHLILHPNYVQAFMMLTIDLHTSRGELYAVYTKSEQIVSTPFTIGDIYSLIEDFVNACCFHLWLGLYS